MQISNVFQIVIAIFVSYYHLNGWIKWAYIEEDGEKCPLLVSIATHISCQFA